jgi:hypothetical protein
MSGRPRQGYVVDGERVPGVTTILGRFKASGGLIEWAWKCGRDGIDIHAVKQEAADAGTCCHEMIDADLHGRPFDRSKWKEAVLAKAEHAYLAFLEWRENTRLTVAESERPLVSKAHLFGGTLDALIVGGKLRLGDYKTANAIYADHLIQVAGGYSLLWQENFPDRPLDGVEILRFSKPDSPDDPVSFTHQYWSAEVFPVAQRQFLLLRDAYDLDKRLSKMV